MPGHSLIIPIKDEIYVGEDDARYRPSSIRHAYSTDDFYCLENQNTNNCYANVVRDGSKHGNYS